MRYTPTKDCFVYYEWPNLWDVKPWFSEPPKKRKKRKLRKAWEEEDNVGRKFTIPYWRDIEKHNEKITEKDLHFRGWPKTRRKKCEEAKLPPELCHGLRFIKLTMDFPLGWLYRDMPMNIQEIRDAKKAARERRKALAKKRREAKKAKKAAKAAAKREAKAAKKGKR